MVLKALIVSIALLISLETPSIYSVTKKRADKVLSKYWEDEEYNLSRVTLIGSDQPEIYSVQQGNSRPFAYVLFAEAMGKVDTFTYLIIFNPDGIIEKVSVLLYRENYGGEIGSKRFLKQFNGKSNGMSMEYNQDIDGISGATISVQAITRAVRENSVTFSNLIEQLK
jgi:Na+-translocating ferredoxin:NAD+ oxidoreductase RnfG subunit